ncbi:SoxR reducing system RseC family protein [Desulfonatronum thioautotrophicum]|uniref:SoxR reducing system RseC family protein n=1 Tax=Desulfonatronum thioautotrophicum TaxID=617001 RepID=UPI000A00D372|nr:SoxR reducing system RseC family protein [Desulfonatronum thioautotrophicum]
MSLNPFSAPSVSENDQPNTEADHSCSDHIGTVLSRRGQMARVQIHAPRQCATCTCSSSRSSSGPTRARYLTVVNAVDAQSGQRVRISKSRNASLAAPAVLFGVPLIGLLGGALGANRIAPFSSNDLNTLIGAGVGLAAGFLVAKLIVLFRFSDPESMPKAIAILSKPATEGPCDRPST